MQLVDSTLDMSWVRFARGVLHIRATSRQHGGHVPGTLNPEVSGAPVQLG